jgi:hypothetical protein
MAENERQENVLRPEDVIPVRSRISWGAIFAGAFITMAVYLVLTLLGGSIGLSLGGNVRAENLATGAAIWAVATTVAALFIGGWVTSQVAVGENHVEAVVHGIVMWGLVLAMLLWLVANSVQAGFGAMIGMSNFVNTTNWQAAARQAGVPQAQIDQAQQAALRARGQATDEETQRAALQATATASWWTLFGIMLSMVSAIVGALVGAGPTVRSLVLQARVGGLAFGSRPAVR